MSLYIININKYCESWKLDGETHRDFLPAQSTIDYTYTWFQYGKLHDLKKPSYISEDYSLYHIEDIEFSEEQFDLINKYFKIK